VRRDLGQKPPIDYFTFFEGFSQDPLKAGEFGETLAPNWMHPAIG
jgi:hypothetical protein